MHRITVVTADMPGSGEPSSPVPALDVASEYSSGEEPSPNSLQSGGDGATKKHVVKISNWRKRGLRHTPSPSTTITDPPEEVAKLDLSLMQRRDLPIKLVVDEPVPVENTYDDPYTQAFVDYFKHPSTTTISKSHSSTKGAASRRRDRRRTAMEEERASTSTGGIQEVSFATFKHFDSPKEEDKEHEETRLGQASNSSENSLVVSNDESPSLESGSQKGLPRCKNDDTGGGATMAMAAEDTVNIETVIATVAVLNEIVRSASDDNDDEVGEETRDAPQEETDASLTTREDRRKLGPVIRMEYEGEMVSVSGQTATKVQEGLCSWV